MNRKKLLRSGLAVLCIASMVIGYFGGLVPESKVEAAETVETLQDFDEVTPKDFGIEDFFGTEKTEHKSTVQPVTSVNQKTLSANIVFGAGATIYYCEPWTTGYAGGIGLWLRDNGKSMRFYNYAGDYYYYIGGEFVQDGENVTYQGGTKTSSRTYDFTVSDSLFTGAETLDTKEVLFSLSTELIDFDLDGATDDLKVGIWFNGMLQDNCYIYVLNSTVVSKPYLQMNVKSCTSPFGATTSQWDDYKVVTPATFGIPDYVESVSGATTSTTAQGIDVVPYEIDKTMFQADIVFKSNETSNITYLYNSAGQGQLAVQLSVGSNSLRVKNNKKVGDTKLYIGGKFEEGVYVQGTHAPVATGGEKTVWWEDNPAIGAKPHNLTKFKLWVTTEFVDFDGDNNEDDLQIGVWFNGALLIQDTYFYYVDYEETTMQGMLATDNMYTIFSPMVESDDLGLIGGEYASADNGVATSTIATSKVMDGTTLETDVIFNGVGASILYGCDVVNNTKAIKLTSTSEGIQVSHTYGDAEENIVLLDKSKVGIDVLNQKFHLKLTTDVLDSDSDTQVDDVKLGIQVNNKACGFFIPNVATQLTSANTGRIGVECTGDASVILGRIASDAVEDTYHCLDDGVYTKNSSDGISRLSVDGVVITDDSFTLDTLGTSRVIVTENRQVIRENVTLYKRYDVNESKTVDVLDLVRMLKVANDNTHADTVADLGRAGQLAISYESADVWSNDIAVPVLEFMRRELVGTGTPEEKTGEITLINREQLQQFANEYGAFMNSFTFTADLSSDSIERLNQIWILSTNAKYISMNGKYPTIQYKITTPAGSQLYISQPYEVGDKDVYVERQWRVPETLEDYTTLHVSFMIPDGVALYINDISAKNNVEGELSATDDTVYSADNGVKYLAHSGFIGYAPDNTILGFEMAGKMGFKSLITIPKFTKAADGEESVGVCFHDDYIQDRLRYATDGSEIVEGDGNYGKGIEDFKYSELAQFDAGLRKGEAFSSEVPTLEQYFYYCDKYQMAPIFSVHPELTEEQWKYVKGLLLDQTKGYKQGSQQVLLDEELVPSTWIYDHFQIKAGSTSGFDVPFGVFGFEIGGYINIQATTFGTDDFTYVLRNVKKAAAEQGINFFDKVSAEIFLNDPALEEKIAYYRSYGFTRISLAPTYGLSGGFSGEQLRYCMDLGVNSFTVDYHGSMGLNW